MLIAMMLPLPRHSSRTTKWKAIYNIPHHATASWNYHGDILAYDLPDQIHVPAWPRHHRIIGVYFDERHRMKTATRAMTGQHKPLMSAMSWATSNARISLPFWAAVRIYKSLVIRTIHYDEQQYLYDKCLAHALVIGQLLIAWHIGHTHTSFINFTGIMAAISCSINAF